MLNLFQHLFLGIRHFIDSPEMTLRQAQDSIQGDILLIIECSLHINHQLAIFINPNIRFMQKIGYVYFISNKNRTVLYTGVTSNLENRILRYKAGLGAIFPTKYNLTDLMFYERIHDMMNAIKREKQLKRWHKEWKWNIVKEENPELKDLAAEWFSEDEIEEAKDMLSKEIF